MVSLSPSQDAAPAQPGEAGPSGQGRHKRSRSMSTDAGEMPPGGLQLHRLWRPLQCHHVRV